MPIRDLSDRAGALPTIGELRKGAPKGETNKNGRTVPVIGRDLGESFRFTADHPLIEEAFRRVYGETPTEITCLLAGSTADECFEAWQEEFGASGLKHRCDGQQMVYQLQADGTRRTWPLGEGPACPFVDRHGKERPRDACRPHGRLRIIPVQADQHGGPLRVANLRRIGQVLVLTTSKHDIKNIAACLHWYERISGSLAGIPFILRRTPVDISMPRPDGTRARGTKWLIDLTPSPEWVTLKLEEQRQRALCATPGAVAALPAPTPGDALGERPPAALAGDVFDEDEEEEEIAGTLPALERERQEWESIPDEEPGAPAGPDRSGVPDATDAPNGQPAPENTAEAIEQAFAQEPTGNGAEPPWARTPLGRQVMALADALTDANKKFALPADEADEQTLSGWLASKKTLLAPAAK